MPGQIVFPCPNCGATQSAADDDTSIQCQFCGTTITVPEALRPKPPATPPAAASQTYSFGGAASLPPGMAAALPGMFQNMDLNKLRAMAMAARAGDTAEAARLYSENFGVSPEDAMQAAQLMAQHHHVVLGQMTYGNTPQTVQFGGVQQAVPQVGPGTTYNLPSPPVIGSSGRAGRRLRGCISTAFVLLIIGITAGGLLVGFLADSPNLMASITNLFSQVTNHYPRVVLSFGGKGNALGLFNDPRSIAVDSSGRIYVADYGDGRLQIFSPDGKIAGQWKISEEKSPFVSGLAVDSDGQVYASVSGSIYRYNGATGESLGKLDADVSFNFNDVRVRPGGGLAAPSFAGSDNIVLFSSSGQVERVITDAISSVTGNPELDMKIAVDQNDGLYVLGTFNNAVFHYNAQGQLVNHFGSAGDQAGQFRAPTNIAVDGQGQVYVSDIKGIQVFSPDGHYLSVFSPPVGTVFFGMTVDQQGSLYAVANNGMVYKYLLAPPK